MYRWVDEKVVTRGLQAPHLLSPGAVAQDLLIRCSLDFTHLRIPGDTFQEHLLCIRYHAKLFHKHVSAL